MNMIQELSEFISAFDPKVVQSGDNYTLLLPGFEPMPWRSPIKKKFLARRNPNERLYEETTTAAMAYFFERTKNSVLIDAGAQGGYFTTLALSFQSKPIDTYAFEINPLVMSSFQSAVTLAQSRSRYCELLLSGLSDQHLGEKDIWVSVTKMFEHEPREEDFRDPWYTKLKMFLRGRKDRDIPQKFRVMVTSIDHFCAERKVAPGIIKIDVDGYEAKVVPGSVDTLRQHKPIVFLELHKKKFIDRFCVTRNEIVAPLFDLGYKALLLDDHHNRACSIIPITAQSQQIGREKTDMFVFYHESNF
jgi:FkbM family methyltransferase